MRSWRRWGMVIIGLTLFTGAVTSPMSEDYSREVYQRRRARLAQSLGNALAIVLANLEADPGPFVQNPYFYYLTGLEVPGAALIVWPTAPRAEWREVLFLPPRDPHREVWTGPQLAPDKRAQELTGVVTVLPTTQLESTLARFLRHNPTVAVVNEPTELGEPPSRSTHFTDQLRQHYPAVPIINLSVILDDMRRVKDDFEIARIQRAIDITGEALVAAMRAIRPGMREYQVQALIEYEFKRRGALQIAFPSIVGAGVRATVLHYRDNTGIIEDGDLVLMDVGARYAYYCADITRTVPAGGKFTPEQRALYEIVLEAQRRAIEAVRPGVFIEDIHRVVVDFFRERGVADYYPHRTSHYLGLEVHDVGDYNKPLEPGVVITVEPGLYIPEKGVGIRIEDDVLVTPDGYRVLSAHIPKDPDEIERIMQRP